MRIFCAICKDIFIPKSDVKALRCGHLYHDTCLNQWLQIRSNCPQCRALAVDKRRIYFDVEAGSEDPSILQDQVESLNEQNLNNQIVIVDLRKQLEVLEAAKRDLTMQSKNLLEQIEKDSLTITCMKKQISDLVAVNRQMDKLKKENLSLTEELISLKNVGMLLEESRERVKAMIQNTPVNKASIERLYVYIDILKTQIEEYKGKWEKGNVQLDQYESAIRKLKMKIPKKIFTVDKKTGPDEKLERDKGVVSNDNNEVTSRKRRKEVHVDETPKSYFHIKAKIINTSPCTPVRSEAEDSSDTEREVVPVLFNVKRSKFFSSNYDHKLTSGKIVPRKITKY